MNVNVTISTDMPGLGEGGALVVKTGIDLLQKLNPEALEPTVYAEEAELLPELTGPFSAAHARIDPETGDFSLDLSPPVPTWRIFKAGKATGKTQILARIRDRADAPGSYIHS